MVGALLFSYCECYGFDSGASCSDKTARRGRAQLIKSIPCDLSVNAYCNLPGTMYPWNAVRRFVNENQGMMKRMYGDVRHISVLRNEINNNDITLDDVEETAIRYSRASWKRNKYLHQESSSKGKNNDLLSDVQYRRGSQSHSRSTARSTTKATSRTTHKPSQPTISTSSESPSSVVVPTTTSNSSGAKIRSNEKREKPINKNKSKISDSLLRENESEYEEGIEAAIEEIFVQFQNEDDNKESNNIFTNGTDENQMPVNASAALNSYNTADDNNSSNETNILSAVVPTISTTLRIFGFSKDDQNTTPVSIDNLIENNTETKSEMFQFERINTTAVNPEDGSSMKFEADGIDEDTEKENTTTEDDSKASESLNSEIIVDIDGKPTDKIIKQTEGNSVGQLFQDVAEKEEPIFTSSRGV